MSDASTPPDPTPPPIDPEATPPAGQALPFTGAEATVVGPAPSTPTTNKDLANRDAKVIVPFSGKDATLVGPAATPEPPPAAYTGAEATLIGNRPRVIRQPFVGKDVTKVGFTPPPMPKKTEGESEAQPYHGNEATQIGPAPSTPAAPYTGAEATLVGGGAPTTPSGSAAVEQAPSASDATPHTFVGRPRTGLTSTGFDANWHLKGRKGPHTGQTWGDFELGGILGEGGMGAVYRGIQTSLKRRVAIKVLPPNLAQDQRLLERFRLEAGTASRLQSPHVVQVYFIGEQEDNHFYAMEYVDGTDLSEIFRDRQKAANPLTPDEATDYILQAAKGLAEAGRIGIVHRDIKPPNMMVTKDGLLKLADFGIVKVLGESQLTMTGQAVGTPAYCSPEQGRGDGEIDQRSDLYSLGVVFYEIACGKRPFEAATPNALIYRHCFDEPELPKTLNPAISDEIQAIILRCLQKKPEHRYQSANDLVHDLELLRQGALLKSALANYRMGTGADEAKREQMTWFQRHLLPLSAAALLIIGGGVTGGYFWIEARNQQASDALRLRSEQERAALQLRPTLAAALDAVGSLPDDVDQRLDELERLAPDGSSDSDLVRWRAKVAQVRELAQRLVVLDSDAVDAATRQSAISDLDRYAGLVGTADAAATRWSERLQQLTRREEQLRNSLASLFAGSLSQTSRDAAAASLDELARFAPADDALLIQGRQRLAVFDTQVSGLLGELTALDNGERVTEQRRQELLVALGQLSPLLGDGDARVQRWRTRLEAAGDLLGRLRANLTPTFTVSRPPIPAIEAAEGDLDLLTQLVGADDAEVARWRSQVANSRQRVEELRNRLVEIQAAIPGDGICTAAQLAAAEPRINELEGLVAPGDELVATWKLTLRESQAQHAAWNRQLQERLAAGSGHRIGLAEQAQLTALRTRLVEKSAIDPDRAAAWGERLQQEQQRVAQLRERLAAVLDHPQAVTPTVSEDLTQFLRDVGSDDADGQRWAAKAQRVRQLRDQLAVLDERRSVPDGVVALFEQLGREVGSEAPEIQRWQEKVRAIETTLAQLAPLERAASLPLEVDTHLSVLARLVGDDDPTVRRYSDKVARVRGLVRNLQALDAQLAIGPAPLQSAHDELVDLIALVGGSDAGVRSAARRLAELDGPPVPAWAVAHGRDDAGLWAEFEVAGLRQRLRYIPSGHFVLGSPVSEPDHEGDEIAVPVHLSQAYWLADTECSQALWLAIMGDNPSRFPDPQRPVERVNALSAEGFLARLGERVEGFPARLPTEAEWEMAARAGSTGRWWLPEGSADLDAIAWHRDNSRRSSQPLAGRYPNPLGLYDLHGNVSEWVADGYGPYPTSAVTDPVGRGSGLRIARGGSWGDRPELLRAANRIPVSAETASTYLGLRIAAAVAWGEAVPDGVALISAADRNQRREVAFSLADFEIRLRLPASRSFAEPQAEPQAEQPLPADTVDETAP